MFLWPQPADITPAGGESLLSDLGLAIGQQL
jgi:hypothetical protein